MQKFIPILLLLLIVAGCLDAKLSQGEAATCMRASSAELTHIPSCTTSAACQSAFRKTQENGIGVLTGSSTFVERAEREAISGWLRATDAVQRLQKVRSACASGSIGELWGQAQQAGSILGEALLHSERSQIYSWQALQQTMRETEEMQLDEVRDSKAFAAFTSAAELIQEVKTQSPRSVLAQKVQANTQYFAELAKRINGKDPATYDIDISSGFDLLKTPVKILEPGNAGKIIIAFFPTWNSFLNSVRTRKNAVKGVQVLEELVASEMVYHAEVGIAPTQGIHAAIIQKIKSIEEGIRELQQEEKQHEEEANQKLAALANEVHETRTQWNENKEKYEWLESWGKNTPLIPEERINVLEDTINSLSLQAEKLHADQEEKTLPIGSRIAAWREWKLQLAQISEEVDGISQQHTTAEKECRNLGKELISEDTASPARIAAKEVVEANDSKVWEYCTQLMTILQKDAEIIISPAIAVKEKNSLAACVEKTNAYINSMRIGNVMSREEWLSTHYQDTTLARAACESALQQMEAAYEQSSSVVEWNRGKEGARELVATSMQLETRGKNQSTFSNITKKIKQLLNEQNHPLSFDELQKNSSELEKAMEEMREHIRETLQEIAEKKRWKVINPATTPLNTEVEMVLQWEMKNPVGKTINFPITLSINSIPGMEVTESSMAWNESDQRIILTSTQWDEPIRVMAKAKGVAARAIEKKSLGELIGNQVRTHITLDVQAKADTVLLLRMQQHGIAPQDVVEIQRDDGQTFSLTGGEAVIPISEEKTKIAIDAVQRDVIRSTTNLKEIQTREGIQITSYEVEWENTSEKAFQLSASTGIRTDPIETLSIHVTDELGTSIPWTYSEGQGIVIQSQEIEAKSKRRFSIITTQPTGTESWKVLKENLLQEIIHYTSSPFASIAAKAIALRHRVEQWEEADDSKKWAEGLQKWQLELESLAAEENMYWQKKAALTERKSVLKEIDTQEWKRQREAVDAFMEENNLVGAQNALEWLEEQSERELSPEPEAQNENNEKKNELLREITQLNQKVSMTRESSTAYAQEQGITCNKLLETDFVCPLSENQLKDLRGELDTIQKELRENEKQLSKGTTTNTMVDAGFDVMIRLQNQINTIDSRIAGARKALQENAEQTARALGEDEIMEEEWKNSVQKVLSAIQEKQYGKAIYVGRNLLSYAQSKRAGVAGLTILPEKTLPVVGVILAVGGIGIAHWWKKKKQKPVALKSIPRASEHTMDLPKQEIRNDEPTSQNMKMEFPPTPPTQTELAPQSLPTTKKN